MAPELCDLSASGYTVQKWIGHCFNGFGDVYLGRYNDATRVAIKRINMDDNPDGDAITNELRHLKSLRHPSIMSFHAAFVYEDNFFLATPSCSLGSALDLILCSYPNGLPEKAVSKLLSQLLQAVSYIHDIGIIHRSIRASHLLLDSTGSLKLTGFRCAVHIPKSGNRRLTEFERTLEGSLLWLAPEVLAQDLNGYGVLSDVYSIGVSLCELANGFPPFSDMEPLQMLYEKARGTTPKLLDARTLPALDESEHSRRDFTDAFHDITEQCLRANQFNRPHANELMSHPFLRRKKKTMMELLGLARPMDEVERVSERPAVVITDQDAPVWV